MINMMCEEAMPDAARISVSLTPEERETHRVDDDRGKDGPHYSIARDFVKMLWQWPIVKRSYERMINEKREMRCLSDASLWAEVQTCTEMFERIKAKHQAMQVKGRGFFSEAEREYMSKAKKSSSRKLVC